MSRRNAPRRKQSSTTPAWMWFVLGAFAGGGGVFALLLDDLQADRPQLAAGGRDPAQENTEPAYSKPQFDFYRLLKESEIKVPQTAASAHPASAGDRESASGRGAEPELYILQVASFRDAREAEKLRAQLILSNLDVSVETSSNSRGTWHRVLVGPYQNRSKMARARQQLAERQLMPLVLKRPAKN